MTLYALTGTPGTGKSSLSAELRSRGYNVIDGKEHIRSHGLMGELDKERDTHEVDLDDLNDSLQEYRDSDELYILDSHLSHFMDSSGIIVLRCDPNILAERLRERGYGDQKVLENVQSEILDVILCEATESDIPVWEVDCSHDSIAESADSIEQILKGKSDDYLPGKTDWSSEMDKWF
jgi:adenylate kinase